MPSYREVVAAYAGEYPLYEKLAEAARSELEVAVKRSGVYTMPLTARAKDIPSFGIKACVGRRYDDPVAQITDKAGVRVITIYERDIGSVVEVVRKTFHTLNEESKLDALDYDKNGYLGVHLDVELTASQSEKLGEDLAGRVFEVQVRTMAQSAWAEVSHAQLYKPPAEVPDTLKRRIYRLVALVELFDSEVEAFRQEAEDTPGYREAGILGGAGTRLADLGNTRTPNRRLTLELAAAVVPLYAAAPDVVAREVDDFIDERASGLRNVIQEAENLEEADINPLLTQPELPMICERLERDRIHLEQVWPTTVPFEWLDDLAEKWGLGRKPD